jgi:hypothetical protein
MRSTLYFDRLVEIEIDDPVLIERFEFLQTVP